MSNFRDLKLQHLVRLRLFSRPPVQTTLLAGTADAFVRNSLQVKSLSLFPLLAIQATVQRERIEAGALMRLTGSVDRLPEGDSRIEELRALDLEMWDEFLSIDKAAASKERAEDGLKHAMFAVQRIAGISPLPEGVDSWLSAQVVGGWTAFETMAGDLWEAALNCHPHGLSELKGKQAPLPVDARQNAKTIPLTIFQRYKFDLSKSMGTILRERRGFDTLENIRGAYLEAFFSDATEIENILSSSALDTLNAVRNLIVHRAAIVDQKYLGRTKSLPTAPRADVGKPILIDGEVIANLVQPVFELGCRLIVAVDNWLLTH
jgi:hypothetical protein